MILANMHSFMKLFPVPFFLVLGACQDAVPETENEPTFESESSDIRQDSKFEKLASNQVHIKPEPDWAEASKLEPIPDNAKGLVFLRRNDLFVHLDGNGQSTYRNQRMKLLASQALGIGNLSLVWNPSSGAPLVHTLLIHRNGETIDVLKNNAFEVLRREGQLEQAMLNGYLTAVLRVPDLRVGDELEWAYTVPSHDPTLKNNSYGFMTFGAAPQPGSHKIGISWEKSQKPTLQFTKDLEGFERRTERSVSITLTNPELLNPAKHAPPRYDWLRVIEYSDFETWRALSARFHHLYEKASRLPKDSDVKQEAKQIAETHSSDLERTKAALELVQQQVRYIYVGLDGGNIKPATADDTWQRRYGDCKGKSVLLVALLRELGIKAELVLVNNSGIDDGFDSRLPNPALFNHILLRMEIEGTQYWLDPTLPPVAEPSQKPITPYRWILPLSEKGNSLEPGLQAPFTLPQKISLVEYDARAGFDQPARKIQSNIQRGIKGLAEYLRYSALTPETLKAGFKNNLGGSNQWDTIEDIQYRYDRDTRASILTIIGTGPVDWDEKSNGRYDLSLPGGGFRPPYRRQRVAGQAQDIPFYNAPSYSCDVTTIRLPQDTKLINWGFNTTYDTKIFGRRYYRMMERRDDHTIRMVRVARVEAQEITPDQANRDNARIDAFDNSMAQIEYVPNKVMMPWGANHPVPATYEIDWVDPTAPCLPNSPQPDKQMLTYREELEIEAGKRDAAAQYELGKFLRKDFTEEALGWFEKAAAQGHKKAHLELGWHYGQDETQLEKAAQHLNLSEDKEMGAFLLADIYFRNPDIFPDITNARIMELYYLSAQNDYALAQQDLAQRYKDGSMVKRDEVEALKWIFISDGFEIRPNDRFKRDLSEEDQIKAQKRAEEWIQKFRKTR